MINTLSFISSYGRIYFLQMQGYVDQVYDSQVGMAARFDCFDDMEDDNVRVMPINLEIAGMYVATM